VRRAVDPDLRRRSASSCSVRSPAATARPSLAVAQAWIVPPPPQRTRRHSCRTAAPVPRSVQVNTGNASGIAAPLKKRSRSGFEALRGPRSPGSNPAASLEPGHSPLHGLCGLRWWPQGSGHRQIATRYGPGGSSCVAARFPRCRPFGLGAGASAASYHSGTGTQLRSLGRGSVTTPRSERTEYVRLTLPAEPAHLGRLRHAVLGPPDQTTNHPTAT
jgi:hypothetical protein